MCLVNDQVLPGFRVAEKKRGRKVPKGQVARDALLLEEMYKVECAGKSVHNAARSLVKRSGPFKGRNPEALRQRYYHLKDPATSEGKRVHEFILWMVEKQAAAK